MSKWNPDHWKQYNESDLKEFREHLRKYGQKDSDYQQWAQEIDTVLQSPDQSNQSRQQSE